MQRLAAGTHCIMVPPASQKNAGKEVVVIEDLGIREGTIACPEMFIRVDQPTHTVMIRGVNDPIFYLGRYFDIDKGHVIEERFTEWVVVVGRHELMPIGGESTQIAKQTKKDLPLAA